MMVSLSGSSPAVAAQSQAAAQPVPAASTPSPSRASQPDTVSISAQGRQMAAHDADRDGDSA